MAQNRTWKDYTPEAVCERAANTATEITRASQATRAVAIDASRNGDPEAFNAAVGRMTRLNRAATRVVKIFEREARFARATSRTLH
jgi:hypothetical protein